MWHWQMGGMMWSWWLLGAALLAAVVWAVARSEANRPPGNEAPEDIVKRRFARGEIDRREYESTLAELRG